jgi:hypothetical protein
MSTTAPTISQTPARHVLWYFGENGGMDPGRFIHCLIAAICAADPDNQARLATIYPEYVAAVLGAKLDPDGTANLQRIAAGVLCTCGDEDGPWEDGTCEGCLPTAPGGAA